MAQEGQGVIARTTPATAYIGCRGSGIGNAGVATEQAHLGHVSPAQWEGRQGVCRQPLGLVVRDQTIYLVCTLWDYPDIKQLVLNRVHSATLQDEPATRLKGFDLDKYIAEGEFGLPAVSGKKLNLVADFSRAAAVTILERALDKNQKVEDIDENTVRLTATVPDTRELRWWLLGFGDQSEVLEPKTLRGELATIAGNLSRRYNASRD
jgi:predicted DNA-binding transcriptional regulator YafY